MGRRFLLMASLAAACTDPVSLGSTISAPQLATRPSAEVCKLIEGDVGGFSMPSPYCPVSGFQGEKSIISYSVHHTCTEVGFGCGEGKTVIALYEIRYHSDGMRFGVRRVSIHEAPVNATVNAFFTVRFVPEASAYVLIGFAAKCAVLDPADPPSNEECFANRSATVSSPPSPSAIHDELYYSVDNSGGFYVNALDVEANAPKPLALIDAVTTNESPVAILSTVQTRPLDQGGPCSTWVIDGSQSRAYTARPENQGLTFAFELLDESKNPIETITTANSVITRDFCPGLYYARLFLEDQEGGRDATGLVVPTHQQ